MQIRFKINKRTLIAKIEGEIDHHASIEIRESIDKEINKNKIKNLIFDFQGLNFMDSSGIGVIIGRYKLIQKLGGKVMIVHLKPQVERIVQISGLHKIIPVFKDLNDALKEI